jgi:hypothetical protein
MQKPERLLRLFSVWKESNQNFVGTPLLGCPTALPRIADTSGEMALQEHLSLNVQGFLMVASFAKLW